MLANVKSAEKLLEELNLIECISGLKVNKDKTEGMWLAS